MFTRVVVFASPQEVADTVAHKFLERVVDLLGSRDASQTWPQRRNSISGACTCGGGMSVSSPPLILTATHSRRSAGWDALSPSSLHESI